MENPFGDTDFSNNVIECRRIWGPTRPLDDGEWLSGIFTKVRPPSQPFQKLLSPARLKHLTGLLDDVSLNPEGAAKSISLPCEKPHDVLEYLITLFSSLNDHIWDPACGSGSVAKAAIRRGRQFFGSEICAPRAMAANEV